MNMPWECAITPDQNRFYVEERETSNRPILLYTVSRNTNWLQREIIYDQRDAEGNYIAGDMTYGGVTADNTYVYMVDAYGKKLIRIHQETKNIEIIGKDLNLSDWNYLAFNRVDGKVYMCSGETSRVYRFDPYHTPADRNTPWITINDIEHIFGMSPGAAQEGNGFSIRTGAIDGIDVDAEGNLYLGDYHNHIIWKVDKDLNGTVHAGTPGTYGYRDGLPSEAIFNGPYGVCSTSDGKVYVADHNNFLIRCIAIQ
jgi:DNA-binding beta-propeller fold protein YncE